MEGLFKPTYKTTDVHDSQYTVKQKVDKANAKMFLSHEVYTRLKSKR